MTTPTTDADRLTQIEEVVDQWRIAEPGNRLTDAEALAKVRALLSGGDDPREAIAADMENASRELGYMRSLEMTAASRVLGDWAKRVRNWPRGEPAKVRDELPPLPDGWHLERYDAPTGSHWSAWRERDAATVAWWDDGDIVMDVLAAEESKGDEVLAVLQHLAARRAK